MQNCTFSAEAANCTEWGQNRSGERTRKIEVKEKNAKEFVGWISPPRDWELWIQKLSSVHKSTWKNAGIYEAIMSSIYKIRRHDELILELSSKWCSKTNTFVFPWGDATLTLEDMKVLGGFSASGLSALTSIEDDIDSVKIKEQLELAMKEIHSSKCKCRTSIWIKKFMGSGNEYEHAAFLSLWLSRFVFTSGSLKHFAVRKNVFPVAAKLSKGIKIALGPAVLANLYKKLTAGENADLRAPFHLVQIWAWERFPFVDCVFSSNDLPRIARWSKVKIPRGIDLKSFMDCCGEKFLWCPYGTCSIREETDPDSFALCMNACEIVGFDSHVEKYQPQYVIRQFGFDQTTTTTTATTTSKSEKSCNRKVRSLSFQPTITYMYEKWSNKDGSNVEGKAMEVVKELVHETREDEVQGSSNVEGVAMEVVNGSVDEVNDESFMYERYMDSGLELEARIRRLEDLVYGHIREMEADKKNMKDEE